MAPNCFHVQASQRDQKHKNTVKNKTIMVLWQLFFNISYPNSRALATSAPNPIPHWLFPFRTGSEKYIVHPGSNNLSKVACWACQSQASIFKSGGMDLYTVHLQCERHGWVGGKTER